MQKKSQYGILSVFFGFLALLLAHVRSYANSISRIGDGWFFFDWLEKFGLINHSSSIPTLSNSPFFHVSEQHSIYWIVYFSICFALISALSACVAEFKKEHNLHLSAGYIMSTAAGIMINLWLGLLASIIVFFAIMFISYKQKA